MEPKVAPNPATTPIRSTMPRVEPTRTSVSISAARARDPIPAFRARLEAAGVEAAALDQIDAEVAADVAEAEAEARGAPEPGPEVLETQVWADGTATWRN